MICSVLVSDCVIPTGYLCQVKFKTVFWYINVTWYLDLLNIHFESFSSTSTPHSIHDRPSSRPWARTCNGIDWQALQSSSLDSPPDYPSAGCFLALGILTNDPNQAPSRLKDQRTTLMAHPRFHFRFPLSLFLMLIQALPKSFLMILKIVRKAIGNVACQMRRTLKMSLHRSGGSLRYANRLNRIDNTHFHRHRFSVLPHAKNLLGDRKSVV